MKRRELMLRMLFISCLCISVVTSFCAFRASRAQNQSVEDQTAELQRKTQNPVSDLISLPFQNNTNFDFGPDNEEQNILNIQPVMPFRLNEDWNLISRTIIPLIQMPELIPGKGDQFGLGDTVQSLFLSPAKAGKLIWGIGPVFQLPTSTNDVLGQDKWCAGPTGVILAMKGPTVFGVLANNVWSFASADNTDKPQVNQMFLQPFFNYNFRKGWYLTSAPIITANWKADHGEQWVVPVGGGGGKIFKIGKQAMNAQAQVFRYVESPSIGPDEWALRVQFQLLFPKKK